MAQESDCYKTGSLIITEKPYAFVLKPEERGKRCDYCFKSKKMFNCSNCKYVSYCDRSCQRMAWPTHKFECKSLKRILPQTVPSYTRLMAQIIRKMSHGGADEVAYCGNGHYRSFKDLMSHSELIKEDHNAMDHFAATCTMLPKLLEPALIPSVSELLEIFGKIRINSFEILDPYFYDYGIGLYLATSVLDHSCRPNACTLFDGTTVIVRLLEDVPSLDWSKIKISYTDALEPRQQRREKLYAQFYFWCDCPRCEEDDLAERAMACVNKSCTNLCSPSDKSCKKCNTEFPDDIEETFNDINEFSEYHLNNMQNLAYLDSSLFCLKRQRGILHPLNLNYVQMLANAVMAARNNKAWKDAEILSEEAIPAYIYYYGANHPSIGIAYLMLANVKLSLKKTADAANALKKAHPILKMTYGDDHSLMQETVKPMYTLLSLPKNMCAKENKEHCNIKNC